MAAYPDDAEAIAEAFAAANLRDGDLERAALWRRVAQALRKHKLD